MKRKNKTTKYILAGLFLSSMMGVTTACDPLGIEPTTKVDEERFWENPQLARSYVNNFYFISQSASGDTFQSEQWSDNCQGNYEQDWDTYRQYNLTNVLMMKIMVSLVSAPHGVELIKTFVL